MLKPVKSARCSSRTLAIMSSGDDALFLRGKHHGRAVGVVGAAVVALVAAQFLEAHPNVGLDVFDHVAEVDAAVGIRQRGSDKDFACHGLCF